MLSSEGLCVSTNYDPGFYLGETGCVDCSSLCKTCTTQDNCCECDCEDDSNSDTDGVLEDTGGISDISSQTKQEERHEIAVVQTATGLGSSAVIVGTMMTGSPSIFMSMFMTIELLSFLPFINMKLTAHQVDLLVGSNQLKGLPNYINDLQCHPPRDSRRNYDFDCTDFLRIAQKEIAILSSLGLVTLVLWLLARKSEGCAGFLLKVLPFLRKLLLMILINCLVKSAYSAQVSGIESVQEFFSWVFILVVWALFLLLGVLGCLAALSNSDSYPRLKEFLFNDLKPTAKSRLNFSLLILHRMTYALLIITLDASELQLLLLSIFTTLVTSRQFTFYLLVVWPYQDLKVSILQLGTHIVVSAFCVLLTLFEFGILGNDKDLVSECFMWCIQSIIVLHVVAMLAKVASLVIEILQTEGEVTLVDV
jgi:hypothetical protein